MARKDYWVNILYDSWRCYIFGIIHLSIFSFLSEDFHISLLEILYAIKSNLLTFEISLLCIQVTYKFHCVVRVVSTLPTVVQDFCVPVDSEMLMTYNECQGKSYVYRVRLTLEDPTARIYAYLCFEDAVYYIDLVSSLFLFSI